MSNLLLTDLSQVRDTAALNQHRLMTEQLGMAPEEALKTTIATTRDRCRSPLQWSSVPNAGFSPPDVQPWLPVNANYATGIDVATQQGDPNSLLSFYQRLLSLRRTTPVLIAGDYHALHPHSEAYFAFLRHDAGAGQTCLVVLNFSGQEQTVIFDLSGKQPRLLFSSRTRDDQPLALGWLTLAPFEIFIAELA
jgi:alpha-glucosidase